METSKPWFQVPFDHDAYLINRILADLEENTYKFGSRRRSGRSSNSYDDDYSDDGHIHQDGLPSCFQNQLFNMVEMKSEVWSSSCQWQTKFITHIQEHWEEIFKRWQENEYPQSFYEYIIDNDYDDDDVKIFNAYPSEYKREMNVKLYLLTSFNRNRRFKKACQHWSNKFVTSSLKEYDFVSNLSWSKSQLKEQEKNLMYITKLYGYSLKKLVLKSCLPDKIIDIIKTKCYNIEKLEISLHENQTKEPLSRNLFNNMIHLTTLKINWNFVTETLPMILVESLQQIGWRLKELNISCQLYRNGTVLLPDSLISVFPFLIALEKLSLIDFRLDQKIIDSIANIERLIYLNLSTEFYDSIVNMNPIGNLKKLEVLILKTDEGDTDIFLSKKNLVGVI